jgi:excisionase family DNA binding protein
MMTKIRTLLEPVALSEEESRLALDSSRRLAALVTPVSPTDLTLQVGDGDAEPVSLPPSALPLITRLLAELGQGHAVALLPVETELSTQQAADLLNVSRPFLVGLLEQRQIPYRKVGKHRRILLRDVLAFKRRNEADRLAALAELQAQAQELDMSY